MKKSILAGLFNIIPGRGRAPSISSHIINQPEAHVELSKRKIQKMKGKRARNNRGKNRKAKEE